MPLIEAHALTKVFRRADKAPGLVGSVRHLLRPRFATHVAVDNVDLAVEAGEAVAYVGPNGAGKSTTIKMLSGIVVPTSGEVRVGNCVPHRDRKANAHQIGLLFGQRTQLWWDLPVRDSLALLRDVYGVSAADYRARLEEFDEFLGIGELLPTMARKLSLGQRMRCDLAATLLHRPRIVYLDEPTIGLDVAAKDHVRTLMKRLCADGTTLILTTHDLGDIEDICQRIVIIDSGRIIFDGSLESVKDSFARTRRLHLEFRDAVSVSSVAERLPGVEVDGEPGAVAIQFDRHQLSASQIVTAMLPLGEIADFRIDEPAIEDVIRRVYAGELQLAAEPQ